MKKLTMIMTILMAVTIASAYAVTNTSTIVLVSVVNEVKPQYVLRNTETGEMGSTVVYSTDAITEGDVKTSFEVVQSNNSNYRGNVELTISATELMAKVEGKLYSTEGVAIMMNWNNLVNRANVNVEYTSTVKAGTVINAFDVIWTTNTNLVTATYEAAVTLNYTAA